MTSFLLKHKLKFASYILSCLITVADVVMLNVIIGLYIGCVQIGSMDYFIRITVFSVVIVSAGGALHLIARFLRAAYVREAIRDLRNMVFVRILDLSYQSFSQKSLEAMTSNLTNDINEFENKFFKSLVSFIYCAGISFTSLMVIAFFNLKLCIFILVVSLCLMLITKIFMGKTKDLQMGISSAGEKYVVDVTNTISGLEILKLNSIEDRFFVRLRASIAAYESVKMKYTTLSEGLGQLLGAMKEIISVFILLYLLIEVSKGQAFTIAAITFVLCQLCMGYMSRMLPCANILQSSASLFHKLTKGEDQSNTVGVKKAPFHLNQVIQLSNVSFGYNEDPILKNISITIEKGKKYLIRGESGSGKSTLLKLLSMTYDDYEGTITADGTDYKQIDTSTFYKEVSFIHQDVFIFDDTILNNIRLFSDISEHEVHLAADRAGLSDLTHRGGGLYETAGENGRNLSGGERQRISIARAILKGPSIIFADEPTSSLNEELGSQIENTLLSLNCTLIMISHRFYENITDRFDYVLEVKAGSVVQHEAKEYFREVLL